MTEEISQWDTFEESGDFFTLQLNLDSSLQDSVEACQFDSVHFFLGEAINRNEIPEGSQRSKYALLKLKNPAAGITEKVLKELHESPYRAATLQELIAFATLYPEMQKSKDIVALGTMRTRKVYKDRAGETVWNTTTPDKSICQWGVGLSGNGNKRALIPVEIFLKDLLRDDTAILVAIS